MVLWVCCGVCWSKGAVSHTRLSGGRRGCWGHVMVLWSRAVLVEGAELRVNVLTTSAQLGIGFVFGSELEEQLFLNIIRDAIDQGIPFHTFIPLEAIGEGVEL